MHRSSIPANSEIAYTVIVIPTRVIASVAGMTTIAPGARKIMTATAVHIAMAFGSSSNVECVRSIGCAERA